MDFYRIASFVPQRSIGYLTKRLAKLSTAQIEARFAGQELTLSHWIVLAMLDHDVGDTCAKLARHLGHDSGAMTRLVDQLETRGLIARRRCGDDRRVVVLAITEAGRAEFAKATPTLLEVWNRALAGIPHADIETTLRTLGRLIAAFEAAEAAELAA